ncbi:flagellar motor switch protein FliN [Rhizobium tumorigenes]|uniref:Flagellar motor switch protein FliN n=1 Tax=Rhizobium tumorigenes TaxID=2041385 RepID=A0AAF1K6C5_9HYPH|nr:flagellar motor switch protein FliN [Rhizobium tumorigenes]WFR95791.1 flagellar motor switch protein FliN [Rhizobium tumorigenes]
MAPRKTKTVGEDALDLPGNEDELNDAIDGLRGVLKKDAGDLSDFGGDFGAEEDDAAASPMSLSSFGDFGDDSASTDSDLGDIGDFGGSSFETQQAPGSALTSNMDLIMDIPIDVQIVLGSSRMQVSGLMNLTEGAIIALDKKIGEPVEITVNGRRIARGEITVLENDDTRFGIKLIEVLGTKKA